MLKGKWFKNSMIVSMCAILPVLSACSGNGDTKEADPSTPASSTGATTQPANPFAKKMTLNVYNAGSWIGGGTPLPAREKDVQRQMLENAVNIDLQMTIPIVGEDIAKLNTLLASGDIPDLIFFNNRTDAIKYYQDGLIAELDGYLDQFPKLQKQFTQDQWSALKFKGKTIGTPGLELVSGIAGWWIRNDWLKNLNLQVPTTTEELFQVMKAFTFNDPDKNGKADTYGFVGGVPKDGDISNTAVQGLGLNAIMWLFGVNPHKIDIVDGKLVNHNTDPRMKEAVSYINRLVTEKVIDPDWVTLASTGEKIQKGKIGISVSDWRMMDNPTKIIEVSGETPEWVSMAPVKGPDGKQTLGEMAFQSNMWVISKKAAQDPEKVKRILALLEYWYADQEAYPYFAYGDKGTFWDYNDKKEVVRIRTTTEVNEAMKYVNHYKLPRRAADALYYNYNKPEFTSAVHQNNLKYSISPKPSVYLVPNESDSLYQDRRKFINEALLKFIYGREPITQWDTYVQTLEKTYKLKEYENNVMEQLKEQGVIK
ncbi:MAG: hypothetical protein K0R57_5701 [Paenibacillaceae bacterium]|jgi:putative aldouronate transport system substrate-binding protein|nr:hypothetical protein [Paenibacillaceae bacterium]